MWTQVFLLVTSLQQAPTEPGLHDVAALEAFLDGVVNTQLMAHEIPGATVSVVGHGKLLFAKGYGWSDVEARKPVVAEETMFRIASISKLFTWTAVMQLVERGKLDLNADIDSYLDFEIPDTFPTPITLTHLLTHTPGFEDRSLRAFVERLDDLVPLGEAMASQIPARVRPPGQESSYSNYGTALAGRIVERVSGMPFDEYVETQVFAQLDMDHTRFRQPLPEALRDKVAFGYEVKNARFELEDFGYFNNHAPAGSACATAVDMAKFMLAHLARNPSDGPAILKPETMALMHSRLFTHDARVRAMAHGFYETRVNGQRIIGHGGDLPAFHSNLSLFPDHGVGLFVSYNSDGGRKARPELLQAFVDRYFPIPDAVPPEPPQEFAERAASYVGSYRFNRGSYTTFEKLMSLAGELRVTATSQGTLQFTMSERPTQWVEVAPMVFRQVGGMGPLGSRSDDLVFEADDEGHVRRMFIGNLPFLAAHKLSWWETSRFQLSLVAGSLILSLTMVIGAVRRIRRKEPEARLARLARRLAVTVAASNLVFAIGLAVVLAGGVEQFIYGIPPLFGVLLVLPMLAALLSLGMLGFSAIIWKHTLWTRGRRIHYSLLTASNLSFVWFLDYWNLLGFRW